MGEIAIIGLGLIGGSLGLAWHKALPDWEIVGYARRLEVSDLARECGAVTKTERNLPVAVENADVVVLAMPVTAMKETMHIIADFLREGAIVTDVGSTKRQVMEWAEEALPPYVTFIGGHPMAGKETSGIEAAEATLFEGRPYCIVPALGASQEAVDTIVALVDILGAKSLFIQADEHDGFVAGISHLPFVISAALVGATTSTPSWREMSQLASSGYRSVSRLASGDPAMHAAICQTNKENLLRWMDAYVAELGKLRKLIETDDETLVRALEQIKAARDNWER